MNDATGACRAPCAAGAEATTELARFDAQKGALSAPFARCGFALEPISSIGRNRHWQATDVLEALEAFAERARRGAVDRR